MITSDGWFDWAIRRPIPNNPATGRPWKTNEGVNTAMIFLPHSAVGDDFNGWWRGIQGGIYFPTQLWFNKRREDGAFQLYPIFSQCWASGSAYPNNNGIAAENQGGADTPATVNELLTDFQVECVARACRDIADFKGRDYSYWTRPANATDQAATLYEHRECKRFGSPPTACPSERIRWADILRLINAGGSGEEDDDEMYVVEKPGGTEHYLVRGRTFEHIPDAETFESIAKLQLPFLQPDWKAWALMVKNSTIERG